MFAIAKQAKEGTIFNFRRGRIMHSQMVVQGTGYATIFMPITWDFVAAHVWYRKATAGNKFEYACNALNASLVVEYAEGDPDEFGFSAIASATYSDTDGNKVEFASAKAAR